MIEVTETVEKIYKEYINEFTQNRLMPFYKYINKDFAKHVFKIQRKYAGLISKSHGYYIQEGSKRFVKVVIPDAIDTNVAERARPLADLLWQKQYKEPLPENTHYLNIHEVRAQSYLYKHKTNKGDGTHRLTKIQKNYIDQLYLNNSSLTMDVLYLLLEIFDWYPGEDVDKNDPKWQVIYYLCGTSGLSINAVLDYLGMSYNSLDFEIKQKINQIKYFNNLFLLQEKLFDFSINKFPEIFPGIAFVTAQESGQWYFIVRRKEKIYCKNMVSEYQIRKYIEVATADQPKDDQQMFLSFPDSSLKVFFTWSNKENPMFLLSVIQS